MAANINRVVLVGNLTRDPELKHLPSGTALCSLRIAVNTRRKDESGQWTDKPNYFDVSVWGTQGESCAQYLAKGRPVAIDGRLEWREWEARTAPASARRSRSSPTTSSSSAAAATATAAAAASSCPPVPRSRARPTSRPRPPTTTSRSRRSDDMAQKTPPRKRPSSSSAPGRRKSCHFCKDKITEVDYKNVNQLRRYISEKGKIRNRRITGACRRHQRQVAVAVKRAREVALLPYVAS